MTLLTVNNGFGQSTQVTLEVFNLQRWLAMAPNCLSTSQTKQARTRPRRKPEPASYTASSNLVGTVGDRDHHFDERRPALPGQRKASPRTTGAKKRSRRIRRG